jgi:hypothetical protein
MTLVMPAAVFADPGLFVSYFHATHNSPEASGGAKFYHEPNSQVLILSVVVQNVQSSNGKVIVLINGEILAGIQLDRNGSGQLFLSSQNGDDVPDLGAGDHIKIVDARNTEPVLLKGKFIPLE